MVVARISTCSSEGEGGGRRRGSWAYIREVRIGRLETVEMDIQGGGLGARVRQRQG